MRTASGDRSPFSGQTDKSSAKALMRSNRLEPLTFRSGKDLPTVRPRKRPVHSKERNYRPSVGERQIGAANRENPYKSRLFEVLHGH